MSLSNELSSEIATAILSAGNDPLRNSKELQEVIFLVYSTLRKMDDQARVSRKLADEWQVSATPRGTS